MSNASRAKRPYKPPNQHIRDDIDPANTWIVSDTHFGHENIVGFCFRPEDHEQVMIAEWRAHVPEDATVIHLGDISYGHMGGDSRFKHLIAKELTGKRKLFLRGNHDRKGYSFYKQAGFLEAFPFAIEYTPPGGIQRCDVMDGVEPYEPYIVSFSHYPWEVRDGDQVIPRDWRVHGHIHNNGYTRDGFVPFLRNHINMSVEQTKYRPVNLKLLLDAAICGVFPATTAEQDAEASRKREERSQ